MEENKESNLTQSDNVIDFVAWKDKKNNSEKKQTFSDYFKILSFSELLNESNIASSELATRKPSCELILRVDILLKEFQKRLQKNREDEDIQEAPLEGIIFIMEDEPSKED